MGIHEGFRLGVRQETVSSWNTCLVKCRKLCSFSQVPSPCLKLFLEIQVNHGVSIIRGHCIFVLAHRRTESFFFIWTFPFSQKYQYTPPKLTCHLKRDNFKGNCTESNHQFSGDLLVFRGYFLVAISRIPKAGANTTATGRTMLDSARDLFTRSSIGGTSYKAGRRDDFWVFFLARVFHKKYRPWVWPSFSLILQ